MQSVYIKPVQTRAERNLEKQLRQRRDEINREESEPSSLFSWSFVKGEIPRYRQDIAKVRAANEPNERVSTKPNGGANNKPTGGANGPTVNKLSERATADQELRKEDDLFFCRVFQKRNFIKINFLLII